MYVILLTVFIDFIGIALIFPLLPFLARQFGADAIDVTLLIGLYAGMQMLSSPLLGRLSDRFGRKRILSASLILGGFGYVWFAFAPNLLWLFVSRAFTGLMAGNVSVAQAFLADITPPEKRAEVLGLTTAAISLGFVVGPAIGAVALAFSDGYWLPCLIAAGAAATAGLLVALRLPALPSANDDDAAPRLAMWRQAIAPQVAAPIGLLILTGIVFTIIMAMLPLWLERFYGWGGRQTSYVYIWVGLIYVIVQGGLIRPLNRQLKEPRVLALGGALLAGGSLWMFFAQAPAVFIAALSVGCIGSALCYPSAVSLVSLASAARDQGGMIGIANAGAGLARVVAPPVAGLMYEGLHVRSPMLLGLLASVLSVIGALRLARRMRALPVLFAIAVLAANLPAYADSHAIAMHGMPKYGPGYGHFDYVNPEAPKGGRIVHSEVGTFDSANPFIIRGVRAAGLGRTFQSLLARSMDEPFTLYAHLADRVTVPDDRSAVTFRLRAGAKFHDGSEVSADDILFSWHTLARRGRPNHRHYYGLVAEARRDGPRSVTFTFKPPGNRELPLIMGLMAILSKAQFEARPFDRVSLKPLLGTGPYRIDKIDAGRSITYRRLKRHWSDGLPAARGRFNFDVVRHDYYRDESAAFEAFKAGAADVWVERNPRRWAKGYDFPAARKRQVLRQELAHGRPTGMYGLAFNTRRALFRERRVRAALAYGFDFAWVNRTFYHSSYRRTRSYFENSDLAARGRPTAAEQALLAPFKAHVPAEVFGEAYRPPALAPPGGLRAGLKKARALLRAAGWRVADNRLVDGAGRAFRFEILLLRRENEKLALHLARNLARLGIEAVPRLVDAAQYQARTGSYDFDAMFYHWSQSLSPGNEQAFYWSRDAAARAGTRNYPGIELEAADKLIGHIADAANRSDLTAATRALDRVLTWGHYVLPLFHLTHDRVAFWQRMARPRNVPVYGLQFDTWWSNAPN